MIPDWVLLRKFMPYGAKQPPFPNPLPYEPILEPCTMCGQEMSEKKIGPRGRDQTWRQQKGWMHRSCGEIYDRAAAAGVHLSAYRPPEHGGYRPAPVTTPVSRFDNFRPNPAEFTGNLTSDEYRFFVGDPARRSAWSMCRACKEVLYTDYGRRLHHDNGHGANPKSKYENNCSQNLRIAYSELLRKSRCLACKQITTGEKWGIPLCPTQDCIRKWMFGRDQIVMLEMALQQVRHRGSSNISDST